jgi:hypothetical protein
VCDSEFFHRYDEFAEAASYKASSESVWRELKFKREKVINDRIILEKKRRIFYGTSQPHPVGVNILVLWNDSTPTPALAARGCEGKMDRAKQKLTKSRAERSPILAEIENIDKNVLPPLRAQLEAQREKLNVAVEAETRLNPMKEAAIEQNPSARLLGHQDQGRRVGEKLFRTEWDLEGMRIAHQYLCISCSKYQATLQSLDRAEEHQEEDLKLSKQCTHLDATSADWHQRKSSGQTRRSRTHRHFFFGRTWLLEKRWMQFLRLFANDSYSKCHADSILNS